MTTTQDIQAALDGFERLFIDRETGFNVAHHIFARWVTENENVIRSSLSDAGLQTLAGCWIEARKQRNWDGIHMDDWDRVVTKGDEIAAAAISDALGKV